MLELNKIMLIGNLTRDPELRYSQAGSAFCNIGLANNHTIRRKDGTTSEEVCFVDITVFGRSAEACNQYLKKGSRVLVEGRLSYSTWKSAEGQNRSKHNIVADRVQFFPRTQGQGQFQERGEGGGSHPQDVTNYGSNQQQNQGGDSYGGAGNRNSEYGAGSPQGGEQSNYSNYGTGDSTPGAAEPTNETHDGGQEHDHNVPF